jgi:hypothetical protein
VTPSLITPAKRKSINDTALERLPSSTGSDGLGPSQASQDDTVDVDHGPTPARTPEGDLSQSHEDVGVSEEEPEEPVSVSRARLASSSMQTTLDTSGASWSLKRTASEITRASSSSSSRRGPKSASRDENGLSQMALRLKRFAAGAEKFDEEFEAGSEGDEVQEHVVEDTPMEMDGSEPEQAVVTEDERTEEETSDSRVAVLGAPFLSLFFDFDC